MRKALFALALLLLPLFMTAPVFAQFDGDVLAPVCDEQPTSAPCQSSVDQNPISGRDGAIMRVVNILSWVTGVAAIIVGIYAGLKYVLANGDGNSITTARNSLLYALIGVVVFAASQLIIRFVISQV